jgi:hypothetical protein
MRFFKQFQIRKLIFPTVSVCSISAAFSWLSGIPFWESFIILIVSWAAVGVSTLADDD